MEPFGDWLQAQLNERGWSHSELARRAKKLGSELSAGRVDQIVSGDVAGQKACQAIARALGLNEVEVYRRAGLLPAAGDEDKGYFDSLVEGARELSVQRRIELSYLLDALRAAERAEQEEQERLSRRQKRRGGNAGSTSSA